MCFERNNFGGYLCLKNEFVLLFGVWSDNLIVMLYVLVLLLYMIGIVDIRVIFVMGLFFWRIIFFCKSYKINKFWGKYFYLIILIFNFVCLLILLFFFLELLCIFLLCEFVFIKFCFILDLYKNLCVIYICIWGKFVLYVWFGIC